MELSWIFKDQNKLTTPVGYFYAEFGGKAVPFHVAKNPFDLPCDVYADDNKTVIGTLHTDTNYVIGFPTKDLVLGKEYTVRFSAGKWEFCASDEYTNSYDTIIDDWAVGIGAYDPNGHLKEKQDWEYSKRMGFWDQGFIQQLASYDETDFSGYTVDVLEDCSGFKFKVFDYSRDFVRFEAGWIKIDQYPAIEYEGALGFWQT